MFFFSFYVFSQLYVLTFGGGGGLIVKCCHSIQVIQCLYRNTKLNGTDPALVTGLLQINLNRINSVYYLEVLFHIGFVMK